MNKIKYNYNFQSKWIVRSISVHHGIITIMQLHWKKMMSFQGVWWRDMCLVKYKIYLSYIMPDPEYYCGIRAAPCLQLLWWCMLTEHQLLSYWLQIDLYHVHMPNNDIVQISFKMPDWPTVQCLMPRIYHLPTGCRCNFRQIYLNWYVSSME